MSNDSSIRLGAQPRRLVNGGLTRSIEGLRIRLPALALAASQALAGALSQRNGGTLLLNSGFNSHTIDWLRTLTDTERLRACQAVEVVLPAAVFNAQAAIKHPISSEQGGDGVALDDTLIEQYLIMQGAHAGMMLDVCGMNDYDYRKQLKALGLPTRMGRPARLSSEGLRTMVLNAWSKLLRAELSAVQRAAAQGEACRPKSRAALYLELHYQSFANESLAALYNVLCDVPMPNLELGSRT